MVDALEEQEELDAPAAVVGAARWRGVVGAADCEREAPAEVAALWVVAACEAKSPSWNNKTFYCIITRLEVR